MNTSDEKLLFTKAHMNQILLALQDLGKTPNDYKLLTYRRTEAEKVCGLNFKLNMVPNSDDFSVPNSHDFSDFNSHDFSVPKVYRFWPKPSDFGIE